MIRGRWDSRCVANVRGQSVCFLVLFLANGHFYFFICYRFWCVVGSDFRRRR